MTKAKIPKIKTQNRNPRVGIEKKVTSTSTSILIQIFIFAFILVLSDTRICYFYCLCDYTSGEQNKFLTDDYSN